MIKKAVAFATQAHEGEVRKGTTIPYITHPLETAVIVSLITEEEEMIAAALLHDVIEDTSVTRIELEQEFGMRVADFVAAESEDKSKSWEERKSSALAQIEYADRNQKILTLADKLSNMRSIARDYLALGDQVWERFNVTDISLHAWYYLGMLSALSELNYLSEYQEFKKLCELVFGISA